MKRVLRKLSLFARVLLLESLSNFSPCGRPYSLFLANVVHKLSQSCKSPRPPYNSTVKSKGHHLGGAILALLIKNTKCVLDVYVCRKAVRVAETTTPCDMKLEIVAVIRVWDHQASFWFRRILLSRQIEPIWHVVCVVFAESDKLLAHLIVHFGNEHT